MLQQTIRLTKTVLNVLEQKIYRQYNLTYTYIYSLFVTKWHLLSAPCKQFDARPFAGGYIKSDGYKHNEEVTFGCREPYVIDGQETLRCDDGKWSNRLPSCGGLFLYRVCACLPLKKCESKFRTVIVVKISVTLCAYFSCDYIFLLQVLADGLLLPQTVKS